MYKQQKDNPTKREINAFKLTVFERKTKAERTEGQTPPHQARRRQSLALLGNKIFYERDFEVCLSVEKYDQNHSLHRLFNIRLRVNTLLWLRSQQLVFLVNGVPFCIQIIKKTIEQNDEAFFLQNTFPISLIHKN